MCSSDLGLATAGTLRLVSSAPSQSFSLGNSSLVLGGSGSGAILFTGTDSYTITSAALNNVSVSGTTTNASNSITVSSTAGLIPGMPITGTGIPAGAYITAIRDVGTFLISANATTGATNTLYASGVTGALTSGAAGDFIIHQYAPAQTLTLNAPIADNAAGNSINFVKNGPGQVTMGRLPLSVSTTFANASTTLTVGSTTGLAVGMYVVGTGIAPSTRITAITSGTSITVGTATTAAGTSTSLQYSDNTYTGTTTVNQGVLKIGRAHV